MLNDAQSQAVRVPGHCVITAPPGSGKTKVLEHRAAYLLDTQPKSSVLGVTFTADAAVELEARIRKQYPGAGKRLLCGTFHSLCKRQLQAAGQRFVLLNEVQQNDLIRRAYYEIVAREPEEAEACPLEQAIEHINMVKSLIEPMIGSSPLEKLKTDIFVRYQELLDQMGALDFADLLINAVRGMRKGTVKPWPITHMLVDECQDSDDVQYAWVREHSRSGTIVSIVGDDDQSVYSWRSALGFKGMQNFLREYNAAHVSLHLSYRCAQEILTPAKQLIGCNTERVPKTILTANKGAGSVKVVQAEGAKEELDKCIEAIKQSGTRGDWGVLARTNDQLDALERSFEGADIQCHRSGGMSFWDIKGPALFLGVCSSIAFNNLIGVDDLLRKCGVGEDKLRRMHTGCASRQPGSLSRFAHGGRQEGVMGTLQERMRDWSRMLGSDDSKQNGLAFYGIVEFIKVHAKVYEGDRQKKAEQKDNERLQRCAEALSGFKGSFANRLASLQRDDKKDLDENKVRVMTLHASKGLEFRNVWILGCEQGIVPSSKSTDMNFEEERRLFYVGMTRAKDRLFLSYTLKEKGLRSVFLTEAGL